jgi:phospholipase C
MHPPHDVLLGDALIATVFRALSQGKDWNRTLFVLLFDEHGGFYDHVPPPGALDPAITPDVKRLVVNPDGKTGTQGFNFDRFGVRVPCILASPALTSPGPDHTVYDHSSLIASVRKVFGISSPLGKRDAVANDFLHLLQGAAAPTLAARAARIAAAAQVTAKPLAPPSFEESLFSLGLHFHIHHHRHAAPSTNPAAALSGPKAKTIAPQSKASRGAKSSSNVKSKRGGRVRKSR